MGRVRRHHGAIWWAAAAGAAVAAAWWLFAGTGTSWYWRAGPALVWVVLLAAAGVAALTASRRSDRHGALTRAVVASAPDAILVVDDDGAVVEFNPAAERMFGRGRDAVVGRRLDDGMIEGYGVWSTEGRHEVIARRADGAEFSAEVSTAPVVGLGEHLHVLHVRDLGDRRRSERAVSDLAAIVQSSDDAIVSLTLDGVIESWNPGAERLYGLPPAEAIGRPISLVEPRGRPGETPAMLALVRRGQHVESLETLRVRRDGSEVHVSLTVSPIVDAAGEVIGAAEIGRDITARKQVDRRVAYLAYHDDLTGLPNRLMFAEHLDLALARAQRHGREVAVLYVDLDGFKHVNDTYGHEAGDQLLRQIARRLERATRATDLVARHGGDEFLVLAADLPADGEPSAREIAHTIAAHVEDALSAPAAVNGTTISAGGSVGIAVYPEDAGSRDELLRLADAAMYRSKERAGRSAGSPVGGDVRAQVPLTARMQLALERNEFVLHYQPILRLEDMRMVGVEALIRWNHPDDGMLAPAAFIPVAERTDLITAISEWVVDEVCRVSRPWATGEMRIQAAVNLPIARWSSDSADRLLATIRASGLEPGQIVVEVSEASAMVEPDRTHAILHDLHRNGVKLAIDDFGTGHSSLSRLTEMPVSTLKIDRAFVRDIPDSTHANAIATTIIQLARNIGAEALAEGIETPEQCAFLKGEGCTLGQGFLFSPAVPADEIEPLFHRFVREPAG
ncbi:MAG TPA: EAL domain-containing protein [Gaiellales bacterium]|nr:EAL domain-containing protein [Gaiellales bacterium]